MIGVLGLAGWTGWPIDISLYITFGLVGVATVADVVHVLSGYLYFHQQGQTHHQAMHSVFSKTAMACLLTSITTSIGVFSLYFQYYNLNRCVFTIFHSAIRNSNYGSPCRNRSTFCFHTDHHSFARPYELVPASTCFEGKSYY